MLIDTDVLIWILRGHHRAAAAVDRLEHRAVSIVSQMELIQGARNKADLKIVRSLLADLGFRLLPLTENIGHRASIYMEEYGLASSLSMADALIAATAVEAAEPLLTGNAKHFRPIKELDVQRFRPETT